MTENAQALRARWTQLTDTGFPRSFPIAQFPNAPLGVALLAGALARLLHGWGHDYASAACYLALTIWAYEELAHGVNWFRRLLGAAVAILMLVRVAGALHG